jgi:hypothetical protein
MKRVLPVLFIVLVCAAGAAASERHFTYTYESGVLRPGAREFEPWSTFRLGKSDFYSRLDTRLEAELGLTDRLQTALYLNLKAVSADTPLGRSSTTELEGISSEWKLELADPVADRAGVALYGELSAGPSEVELEGKLIRQAGGTPSAPSTSWRARWEFEEAGTEGETKLEADAAACLFLTPRLTAGLEVRSHTVLPPQGAPTRSALFLGPTVSYAREGWWVAASVLPQVWAPKGASDGHLDLEEHERIEVRLLFGLEF